MKRDGKQDRESSDARALGQRADEILECITDAFYAVDANWRLIYINHRAEEWWQRRREELLGTVLWDMFPEPEKTVGWQMHQKVARERVPVHWETFSPNLKVWVDANAYPTSDGGIAVYFRDITACKQAEEVLRDTQNQMKADLAAMTRLQELGTMSLQEENLETVLAAILDAAIAISGADFGNIQLMDPATSDLRIVVQRGFPPWWLEFWNNEGKGKGTCGTALQRGEHVIVEDVEESPIFAGSPALEVQLKAGIRAVQSSPLIGRSGKPVGMFSTHYRMRHRPDDRVLRLLDLLGRQAADIIKHVQVEEELRQSEERFRALFDSASIGIAIGDAEGRLLQMNTAFREITGYTDDELRSMTVADITHPEDFEAEERQINEVKAGKNSAYEIEKRYLRKDGQTIWVRLSSSVIHDQAGNLFGIGIVQDITERKRAEDALRESEERYRGVVQNTSAVILRLNPQGIICFANERALELFGYSEDMLVGKHPVGTIVPELETTGRNLAAMVEEISKNPDRFRANANENMRKSGERVWMEWTNSGIYDGEGRLKEFLAVGIDATERKRAEEDLRKSEEQYRVLFDSMTEGFGLHEIILNTDGRPCDFRFLELNAAWERLTGIPRAAALGKTMKQVWPGLDAYWLETYGKVALTGEPVHYENYNTPLQRWYETFAYSPKQNQFALLFIDVTERKQAEDALREADRQKNQFLATLSHELRNPLAAIRTSLDILDRVPPEGEQANRAKAVIDRQSGQLAHLVDDLLDVTRITQNKIVLQQERLELNELLRRVFEDFQAAFELNGLSLLSELDPSPIHVTADQTRLAQVFGNLLQNAVKFTPRGGRIIVATVLDQAAGQAIVRIADSGIGIEPEMIPRLFKPFAQIDTGLDRHNGGLGLGLALVKGLVELHGGEVSVASLGTGQGAEFTIRLPWKEEKAEESRSDAALPRQRRRILIIEDNADLAESLRELLELDGHEVEAAGSGPEGIMMACQKPPEILLCDIGLPGMDGFAVARAFREDERLKGVFLVALTGYAQPEDQEKVMGAGFDRHLAKPVELGMLERVLGGA